MCSAAPGRAEPHPTPPARIAPHPTPLTPVSPTGRQGPQGAHAGGAKRVGAGQTPTRVHLLVPPNFSARVQAHAQAHARTLAAMQEDTRNASNSASSTRPQRAQRRYQEARPHLTMITLGLMDLFSDAAWFYFGTSFQVLLSLDRHPHTCSVPVPLCPPGGQAAAARTAPCANRVH